MPKSPTPNMIQPTVLTSTELVSLGWTASARTRPTAIRIRLTGVAMEVAFPLAGS